MTQKKETPPSVGENTESILKGKGKETDQQTPAYDNEQANKKALETPEPYKRPDLEQVQKETTEKEQAEQKARDEAAEVEAKAKKASDKKDKE